MPVIDTHFSKPELGDPWIETIDPPHYASSLHKRYVSKDKVVARMMNKANFGQPLIAKVASKMTCVGLESVNARTPDEWDAAFLKLNDPALTTLERTRLWNTQSVGGMMVVAQSFAGTKPFIVFLTNPVLSVNREGDVDAPPVLNSALNQDAADLLSPHSHTPGHSVLASMTYQSRKVFLQEAQVWEGLYELSTRLDPVWLTSPDSGMGGTIGQSYRVVLFPYNTVLPCGLFFDPSKSLLVFTDALASCGSIFQPFLKLLERNNSMFESWFQAVNTDVSRFIVQMRVATSFIRLLPINGELGDDVDDADNFEPYSIMWARWIWNAVVDFLIATDHVNNQMFAYLVKNASMVHPFQFLKCQGRSMPFLPVLIRPVYEWKTSGTACTTITLLSLFASANKFGRPDWLEDYTPTRVPNDKDTAFVGVPLRSNSELALAESHKKIVSPAKCWKKDSSRVTN